MDMLGPPAVVDWRRFGTLNNINVTSENVSLVVIVHPIPDFIPAF
jgi:hypothetical protein